jgi:hypothetical protein
VSPHDLGLLFRRQVSERLDPRLPKTLMAGVTFTNPAEAAISASYRQTTLTFARVANGHLLSSVSVSGEKVRATAVPSGAAAAGWPCSPRAEVRARLAGRCSQDRMRW